MCWPLVSTMAGALNQAYVAKDSVHSGDKDRTTIDEKKNRSMPRNRFITWVQVLKSASFVKCETSVEFGLELSKGKPEQGGNYRGYRGVRLSELFKTAGVRREAERLAMTTHADGFVVELSLRDIYWSSIGVRTHCSC